jgi:hypothetical protein
MRTAGRGDPWAELLAEVEQLERTRRRLFWLIVVVTAALGAGGLWLD